MRLAIVGLLLATQELRAQAEDLTFAAAIAGVEATAEQRASELDATSARLAIDGAPGPEMLSVTAGTNRLTAREVVGIGLPLPIFGTRRAARVEAAAHARVVAAEANAARRDHERRVALAWLELARSEATIAASTIAVDQATALERIAQGRLDAGAGAEVDVTTARAARARAEIEAASARRSGEAAAAALAGELGWEPTRTLHAAGPLPGGAVVEPVALAEHPERASALARVGEDIAAEHRVAVERRPALGVNVEAACQDPTQPGVDVLAGLTLDIPVFGHVGDRLASARAHTHADEQRVQALDGMLRGQLAAAVRRWQGASERVAAIERDALPPQERATELAQQAYREGARDLSTALVATRDLLELRAELATARIEAAQAWVELQLARGKRPDAP